ncbi:MAG: hypothetical protein U5R46_07325 [Gammaproteobacteria bacterium]|nr:hypothetical protein [Gammaproteobacteria bacterium]
MQPPGAQPDRDFVAFLLHWHGVEQRARGLGGLDRLLRQLQGFPMPFSELEACILPARIADHSPLQLDALIGSGEFVWQGDQALGPRDGYICLYARDDFPLLGRISLFADGEREQRIRELLLGEDGLDFAAMVDRLGGFPDDVWRSLWALVWSGEVTSDSLDPLRARWSATSSRFHPRTTPRYARRRRALPGASGRWRLLSGPDRGFAPEAERDVARARLLLDRWGILTRRTVPGWDVLQPLLAQIAARGEASVPRWLEAGDGFAAPGAEAVWLAFRRDGGRAVLSACDPANPFGNPVPWPAMANAHRPRRAPGARVFIYQGRLVGYMSPTGRDIHTPENLTDPLPLMQLLQQVAAHSPVYLESIDGESPYGTAWHRPLVDAGFSPSPVGYLLRAGV